MRKTTGGRLAAIFLGYATVVLVGGVLAWVGGRPLVEAQLGTALAAEDAALQALHARSSAAGFAAAIAARATAGGGGGHGRTEYLLLSPDGAPLAGTLPAAVPGAAATDGTLALTLPEVPGTGPGARHLRGRLLRFADGTRLLIAGDLDARLAEFRRLIVPVVAAVVLTALAGALAALVFARQGRHQLELSSRAVARILAGDLTPRLPVDGQTGFGAFAAEINVALDRIERLTVTMRTVADSTAHDLRGPLNRLRATVEYALLGDDDPVRLRAALDSVLAEADRLELTLEALLRISLAESGTASLAPVNLAQIVADVVELYRPLAEQKGQRLTSNVDYDLALPGNAQLLAQALANLIDNAIKFTPRTGEVRVSATHSGTAIVLEVADTGPGIAPDDRPRAIERSRRLPNSAGIPGSGLGLALVAAVARLHAAALELDDNRPGLRARLRFQRP